MVGSLCSVPLIRSDRRIGFTDRIGFPEMKVSHVCARALDVPLGNRGRVRHRRERRLPADHRDVIDLLPESTRSGALDALLDLRLGYTEARGTKALRETLAPSTRRRPPTTSSSRPARSKPTTCSSTPCSSRAITSSRSIPAYQQLYAWPRRSAATSRCWELRPENDFRYDLDELERLVRADTKMIVVNTPHNPTGAILPPEELERGLRSGRLGRRVAALRRGLPLARLPGQPPMAPPIRNKGGHGISVGTMSKPFGLPGSADRLDRRAGRGRRGVLGLARYVSLAPARSAMPWP